MRNHYQRGFAVFTYVLAALVLLGATTATMMLSSSRAQTGNQQWNETTAIIAQANLLRSKILDCASQSGDNLTANHKTYPTGSAVAVTTITCPTTGTPNVFTGTDGVFVPPPPTGFNAWIYTNDATSVRLQLKATSVANAAGYNTAMNSAVTALGTAASIVTITSANDAVQLVLTN